MSKNLGVLILKWGVPILKKNVDFYSFTLVTRAPRVFEVYERPLYEKTSIFSKEFIFLNEKSHRYTHQII